jgi:hypothetical protein
MTRCNSNWYSITVTSKTFPARTPQVRDFSPAPYFLTPAEGFALVQLQRSCVVKMLASRSTVAGCSSRVSQVMLLKSPMALHLVVEAAVTPRDATHAHNFVVFTPAGKPGGNTCFPGSKGVQTLFNSRYSRHLATELWRIAFRPSHTTCQPYGFNLERMFCNYYGTAVGVPIQRKAAGSRVSVVLLDPPPHQVMFSCPSWRSCR